MAKGLGKGMAALFPEITLKEDEVVQEISLSEIRPNPYQPRKTFDEKAIEELKQSILEHGILQPIILRKSIKGYEIVAGERRTRASKLAGLEKIPAIVRGLSDSEMMEHALLENLQREDLNVVEEARAYQALMSKLNLTQEKLAKRVGKSRSHIANQIRLLDLPADVIMALTDEKLSMGHARALLGLKNKENIKKVFQQILTEGLNVRQVEAIVQELNENVSRETITKKKKTKSIFIRTQEQKLKEMFGTQVRINEMKNKGKIEIEFYSVDDLNRVLQLMNAIDEE